mmetsp:Transcript_4468/g.13438  ORF Transcript_4468/g.13438 Transcript_4468/m.13438 type:complete len:220 (+) Transcript_4468:2-661(+)
MDGGPAGPGRDPPPRPRRLWRRRARPPARRSQCRPALRGEARAARGADREGGKLAVGRNPRVADLAPPLHFAVLRLSAGRGVAQPLDGVCRRGRFAAARQASQRCGAPLGVGSVVRYASAALPGDGARPRAQGDAPRLEALQHPADQRRPPQAGRLRRCEGVGRIHRLRPDDLRGLADLHGARGRRRAALWRGVRRVELGRGALRALRAEASVRRAEPR